MTLRRGNAPGMPATKPTKIPLAVLVDEFGVLDEQLSALKKKHAEARDALMARAPALRGADDFTMDGLVFCAQISACSWERTIVNMRKLARKLTRRVFDGACTFPLKTFDALIPEAERERYVTREQTGPRKVSAWRRFVA